MDVKEFDTYKHKMYADIYPKSTQQLAKYIDKIINQLSFNNKKSEAEIVASVLLITSNYINRVVGEKGWVEKEADELYMMIKSDARMGLMIYDAMDMLYPQFDKKFIDWVERSATSTEMRDEARYLVTHYSGGINPATKHRWNQIANQENAMSSVERKEQDQINKDNEELYERLKNSRIIDGEFLIQ